MHFASSYRRTELLRSLWPWLPLWLAAALLAIFSHGPVPLYSTRTLAVAWEMWQHGHWLVPYNNGEPYAEKAPLLFWMIHLGWAVFGVSDIWPRVLEVGFGAVELVLLAVLARRLFPIHPWVSKGAPWMLLALSYPFLFGLQVMYDVLLAMWTLAALLCLTARPRQATPRWWLFGLCVGLGLLTKGPVMLLHVLFPWLLGPWWNDVARAERKQWYGHGALALLLGVLILLAWALPAGFMGGEAYRHRLFFTQTAARVVDALPQQETLQGHHEPFWFYLQWLPVLLFPFSVFPRAIAAVACLRQPLETGLRFTLAWIVPTLLVFSLISGKQLYYVLPELAGVMLLVAGAVPLLRERHPDLAMARWLGTWPMALGSFVFAAGLLVLPDLVASTQLTSMLLLFEDSAPYSRPFGVVFLLLGGLLMIPGSRGETRRIAIAAVIGVLALHTLFTLGAWQRYDLRPTAHLLHAAEQEGRGIAYLGNYAGQFHFAGRLQHPLHELPNDTSAIETFAQAHPNGLIVEHPSKIEPAARRYALLVQPFRSTWMVIWPAHTLALLRTGQQPPEPRHEPLLYLPKQWPPHTPR